MNIEAICESQLGASASRFMLTSVHPDLGGGIKLTLGHFSDPSTCVRVTLTGELLLFKESGSMTGWVKCAESEVREWVIKKIKEHPSRLVSPEIADFHKAGLPRT